MPRRERITHAGFYHIVARGVERRYIFLEAEDYAKFLELFLVSKKSLILLFILLSIIFYCLY